MERRANLGLIAALLEECRFVLRWKGWARRSAENPTRLFEHRGLGLRLVISGMGGRRAKIGLETLLDSFHPETVVCFGFGGALDPSLRVGDLIWGREALLWEEGRGVSGRIALATPPERSMSRILPGTRWVGGSLVSVERFVNKSMVRQDLDPGCPPAVLEMETHALGEALLQRGIPLMGLRAVSDEWDFDPGPVVRKWVDDDLRIRAWRVISDVLRHPTRFALLIRLFQRSRVAAASLAEGIRALLNP
jgi:adenosylhomocysteine nucleosidase